ncbi:REP element-mobilizing transposase RayT [Anaerobacterium chartisolvens]|uniref:REP element-mobilizing transposase RayT n=1 Tax=Anaerobacterium chartisolvens TaxID=1297424 RepID=A0A369BKR1_9FIRM|nr:REP element-mobilizing transposase RayT [Anaerobacterium chartisolvens]
MPRYSRVLSETKIYHIMLRGNNRRKIFADDEDKDKIISTLHEKKRDGGFLIYAYCVMDNHIHLVIKQESDCLSRIVKRIGISYAYYFNKKYRHTGHVFHDRFRSETVENSRYLLALIRHLHQNPLKAGISTMEEYKWSSYREYLSRGKGLAETKEIFKLILDDRKSTMEEFIRFNHETTEETFLDAGKVAEIDEADVKEYINGFLKAHNMEIEQLKEARKRHLTKKLVKDLLEKSSLSKRAVAFELGLGRETVRRIALSKAPLSP